MNPPEPSTMRMTITGYYGGSASSPIWQTAERDLGVVLYRHLAMEINCPDGAVCEGSTSSNQTYLISDDPNNADKYGAANHRTVGDENGITAEGYSFAGWNTEPGGSGDSFDVGDIFKPEDYHAGDDFLEREVVLYAQWVED